MSETFDEPANRAGNLSLFSPFLSPLPPPPSSLSLSLSRKIGCIASFHSPVIKKLQPRLLDFTPCKMQALQLLNLQEHIQRTSIGSLPSEVIFLVLTKVGRTSGYRGLSQCARVCKSWSEPSLSLLNRHLEIDIRHLKIISTSGIWKRYRMVSLKFWVMKYEAEISSAMELILRECGPGLTTLVLARRAALVIGGGERIPLRVFDLQSLIGPFPASVIHVEQYLTQKQYRHQKPLSHVRR